jgi:hypothetical protein
MNFKELEYQEGKNNMGGLRPIGYYGFVEEAETIPEPASDASTLETSVTVSTNIVMKAGKVMYPMFGELETAGLKGEIQGERGSYSHKRTSNWFIPGSAPVNLGAAKNFLNRRMFFVFIEMDGQKRLQGTKDLPCDVKPSDSVGTKTADPKGVSFEITDYGFGPVPVYTGTVPTGDASGAI